VTMLFSIWLAGFIVWLCLCLYAFGDMTRAQRSQLPLTRAILVALFVSVLWPLSLIFAIISYARDGIDE